MKFGNLSTQLAPIVGVRFENVIYNYGKVNQPGKAFCEGLLGEDVNLYLISCLPERKVMSWCYKYGVGYTRVIEAAGPLEIPEICFQNKMMMYYDTEDRVLVEVNTRGNPQTKAVRWQQPLGSTESPDN